MESGSGLVRAVSLAALAFWVLTGCAGAAAPKPATAPRPEAAPRASSTAAIQVPAAGDKNDTGAIAAVPTNAQPTSDELPVSSVDPVWGDATAPVTIVAFLDLQCPFCARAEGTLAALRRQYGPHQLRLVFKHNPLPFHAHALSAALAAQSVYEIAGSQAFFAFVGQVYADQQDLSDAALERWALGLGVDIGALRQHMAADDARAAVSADLALARRIGARGTPDFRVNGIDVAGAQPITTFRKVIDAELQRTKVLRSNGVPADQLYARRVAANHVDKPPVPVRKPRPEDTTIWRIAVGHSPVLGPRNAPVTIVEFADFQCPFCKRVQATLAQLMTHYPGKLRIVFKNNPLPFHRRAMPTAMLAMEARREQGDAGFFRAVKAIYARAPALTDADLAALATELHLNAARVKRAVDKLSYKKLVEADMHLADDYNARGTPHFFINGYRVTGAQPVEKFETVIDAQLAKAESLIKQGVPRSQVYAHIMKDAKTPPPPEAIQVAAPTRKNPSKGARRAPILIQEFGDFQCPFTKRAQKTMAALQKAYPGRIRLVWRNFPLPFHTHARMAAEAAMEAFAQKGAPGFWKMHDLLFANQSVQGGLERIALERYAAQIGLDMDRFRKALDGSTHEDVIRADQQAARSAHISGTPAFVINGYFVSGAQKLFTFKRAVDYALKHPHKP